MTTFNPFFHQFFQTGRLLSKKMDEHLSSLGIYSAQWTVLYYLKQHGQVTQSELCTYLNVEAPTMTRNVTRLEKAGWVRKIPGKDKREKLTELTEAAIAQYPLWEEAVINFEAKALEHIAEKDQLTTMTALQQLTINFTKQE